MSNISRYRSPLGTILLETDSIGLTGLWFENRGHGTPDPLPAVPTEDSLLIQKTKHWLDLYFSGIEPDFTLPVHLTGSEFQQRVWTILQTIPYGTTTTYGAIAKQLAVQADGGKMSAQAVGGAVGRNPVSILVPCHRVIGAGGRLIGFGGGLDRKAALLQLEQPNLRISSEGGWHICR